MSLNFYKVYGHVNEFGWLTFFIGLTSLRFFIYFYFFKHPGIRLMFDFVIIYFVIKLLNKK
jgi:hypothetical protein